MPDWVLNHLKFEGAPESLEVLKRSILKEVEDEVFVDFNILCPMPREFEATESGPVEEFCQELFEYTDHLTYEQFRLDYSRWKVSKKKYNRLRDLYVRFGSVCSLSWCLENWGCKWSACDTRVFRNEEGILEVSFKTPWSSPYKWFDRLTLVQGVDWKFTLYAGDTQLVYAYDSPTGEESTYTMTKWCIHHSRGVDGLFLENMSEYGSQVNCQGDCEFCDEVVYLPVSTKSSHSPYRLSI
jgi:hypothetical protein